MKTFKDIIAWSLTNEAPRKLEEQTSALFQNRPFIVFAMATGT
jgi:hypothetical protein